MKKIISAALVVILFVFIGLYFLLPQKDKKYKNNLEIKPEIGSIEIKLRETGSVCPRNRLEIKPQVSGRIEDILVVEGQTVKKGEIISWMSSTDRAALLDIARSKGEEELKKWEDAYKPTPIISPIDGFITARNKEPGQTVSVNDIILVMADKLIIEADVDETDLKYIKLGQKVEIFLDAYPDKKFNGIVEHIAYESKLVSNVNVYTVKILPLNPPKNFRSGMTATIEITGYRKDNILLLPSEVIIEKENKKFVMVKSDNSKVKLKEIKTGISDGKKTEIISGITENEVVLISVNKKDRKLLSGSMGIPGMGRPPAGR